MVIPQVNNKDPKWATDLVAKVDGYLGKLAGFAENNPNNDARYAKKEKKSQKHYLRFFEREDRDYSKNKKDRKAFLKNLWKNLKVMSKALGGILKSVYGSWFGKLLKFILFMAFFDPKGTFLLSIVDFVLKMALMLINAILPLLPKLIKTMLFIITEVFPKIWNKIVNAIFGEKSLIGSFLKGLGKVLIPLFFVLGIFIKVLPFLKIVGGVIKGIAGAMWWLFGILFPAAKVALLTFIKGVLIPFLGTLASFLIPILLVIGALVLIYKFSDKIVAFFDSIGAWFMGLGKKWKVLIVILMSPLIPLIALIYGLAKLFQSIKKIGFEKTMKKIWGSIKDLFKNIWKSIKGFANTVVSSISNIFSDIWRTIKGFFANIFSSVGGWVTKAAGKLAEFFDPIFKALKPIFETLAPVFAKLKEFLTPVGKALSYVAGVVRYGLTNAFMGVKKILTSIMNTFSAFSDLSFKQFFDSGTRARYGTMQEKVTEKGGDLGRVKAAMEGQIAYESLTKTDQGIYDILRKQSKDYTTAMRSIAGDKSKTQAFVQRVKSVAVNRT